MKATRAFKGVRSGFSTISVNHSQTGQDWERIEGGDRIKEDTANFHPATNRIEGEDKIEQRGDDET